MEKTIRICITLMLFSSLLSFCSIGLINAEDTASNGTRQGIELLLAPVQMAGYGLMDMEGKLKLGRLFPELKPFSEGLAAAMIDDKWGYIDMNGAFIIPPTFDRAYNFKNGCARIEKDGYWGTVSKSGTIVINPAEQRYKWIADLSEGYFAAKNTYGKWLYLKSDGSPARFGRFDHAMPFSEGLAAVMSLYNGVETWGYINKVGQIEIEAVYDKASQFINGFAAVKRGYYMSYIDKTGNPIMPFAVYTALPFSADGLAPAKFLGKWGYINTKGEISLEPYYDFAGQFSNGCAVVGSINNGKMLYGVIDKTGRELVPQVLEELGSLEGGVANAKKDGYWGLVTADNKVIYNFFFDSMERLSGDKFLVQLSGKWGVMDNKGTILIYPDLRELIANDASSVIAKFDGTGFINQNGKMVIRPIFDSSPGFDGKSAPVQIGKNWGLVNIEGKIFFEPNTSALMGLKFTEGLTPVLMEDNLYGYINPKGETVIEGSFQYASGFSKGIAAVRGADGWGVIDKTGKPLLSLGFWDSRVFPTGTFCLKDRSTWTVYRPDKSKLSKEEGQKYFMVQVGENAWSIITREGKRYSTPYYVSPDFYSEGLLAARVSDRHKYCFIDLDGKIVIEAQYDDCGSFSEGLCAVNKEGKWGYIDKTGAEIVPCLFSSASVFSSGLAPVSIPSEDGKKTSFAYINKKGEVVISAEYEAIKPFSAGLARVKLKGKWGLIDTTGSSVIECIYDKLGEFSLGFAPFAINDKWGYLNEKGEVVIKPEYKRGGDFSKVEAND